MPIQIKLENGDKVLVIRASGKLVKTDFPDFVSEFERDFRKQGRLRVLFDMTDFKGWDMGAAWEDLKFGLKHIEDIERMAIVGGKHLHHFLAEVFMPFTEAVIRHFDKNEIDDARTWLNET